MSDAREPKIEYDDAGGQEAMGTGMEVSAHDLQRRSVEAAEEANRLTRVGHWIALLATVVASVIAAWFATT